MWRLIMALIYQTCIQSGVDQGAPSVMCARCLFWYRTGMALINLAGEK